MGRTEFDVALIDVDSLIYSITWVHANERAAQKALVGKVEEIIEDVSASDAYVFVKGKNNFRYDVDPFYKANRINKTDPEMTDRINRLYEFAQEEFICSDGGEADDYCSIFAYEIIEQDKVPIVCHIDKDLNMIPGWHWNYKTKKLYFTSPQDSFVAMSRQLLTGDYNDHIPGLKGIGDVTASKILKNRFLHQMKDRILSYWEEHSLTNKDGHGPEWRTRFFKSANCLLLRETMEELRELTEEEILKKMSWSVTEERYMPGITENMDMIASNHKTSIYSAKKEIQKKCPKALELATGSGTEVTSIQTTTTDSSTESTPSSPVSTTSERKASTSTRKPKGSAPVIGKTTRRPRNTSPS